MWTVGLCLSNMGMGLAAWQLAPARESLLGGQLEQGWKLKMKNIQIPGRFEITTKLGRKNGHSLE